MLYNENDVKIRTLSFTSHSQYKLRSLRSLQRLAEDQINARGFNLYLETALVDKVHIMSDLFY